MLTRLSKLGVTHLLDALPPRPSANGVIHAVTERVEHSKRRISGHAWTIVPYSLAPFSGLPPRGGRPFDSLVHDPVRGWVPIQGIMHRQPSGTKRLVILLHGIASTPHEPYLWPMTREAFAKGSDVLRLALRGSLSTGSDHYHAGQTEDLHALFTDSRLKRYDEIFLVGYSLGGQIALRFALQARDQRLRGAVSLCSPISMSASQIVLDGPEMAAYRYGILRSLKQKYRRLARQGEREGKPMAASVKSVDAVRTFYEWDQTVVCPRYGYQSVEEYYTDVSVAPRLGSLSIPALLIFTQNDPFVPYAPLAPYLTEVSETTDVRVLAKGGHLGFASDLQLGCGEQTGISAQVHAWMDTLKN